MKDIFAPLYEYLIYDGRYSLIFRTLYEDGGYVYFGLTFILAPLFLWLAFYKLWKYPYGTILHWLFWLLVSALVVFGITWWIADNEIFFSKSQDLINILADLDSGYQDYADTLPLQYGFYNAILAVVLGFVLSIIMKFSSKIQMHLPF